MKYFLLCIYCFAICVSAAPFPDLQKKEYKLAEHAKVTDLNKTYLSFNPAFYKEINILRMALPKNDPFYMDDSLGAGGDDIVLGVIDISGRGDTYYLLLSDFPSYDISYAFYKTDRVKNKASPQDYIQPDFVLFAPSLIIPSNGNIYSYGHNNNNYSIKKKYLFSNGKITELKQPFFYIGAQVKSLKDQTIYSDISLLSAVYKISKGSPVTVVGIYSVPEQSKEYYMVASEFGLVGYVLVKNMQEESQFTGFYYNGD